MKQIQHKASGRLTRKPKKEVVIKRQMPIEQVQKNSIFASCRNIKVDVIPLGMTAQVHLSNIQAPNVPSGITLTPECVKGENSRYEKGLILNPTVGSLVLEHIETLGLTKKIGFNDVIDAILRLCIDVDLCTQNPGLVEMAYSDLARLTPFCTKHAFVMTQPIIGKPNRKILTIAPPQHKSQVN